MMPYYGVDAHTYVQKHGHLCEQKGINMCMNVSLGLFYIHAKGLVYGDLKLENVCVRNGDTNEPVIVDMGSCHRHKPTITLETASPEALRGEHVTYKHDIWTLGVFFMELTTSCVVNPNKVRNERPDWYRGPEASMDFLRSHHLFASCTTFDRNRRICNFFNLKIIIT
jgi:serine/threonine protein kinase